MSDVSLFLEKGTNGEYLRILDFDRDTRLYKRRMRRIIPPFSNPGPLLKRQNIQHIFANGSSFKKISSLWDRIILIPEMKEQVFSALRLVDENIREVVPVGRERHITPMVLFNNSSLKVPLSSLGDGINRLFQIIVGMVTAEGGMLLIDEFENGLHYSVLPQIWKLLFKMAESLDVQIFATAHSWNCISAFREASKSSGADSYLLQLGRSRRTSNKGEVVVNSYGRDALVAATRNGLDLR